MRSLLRKFVKNDLGSEVMEFALVLALFSIVAITGWSVLAVTASARQTSMQDNLSNTAVNPP